MEEPTDENCIVCHQHLCDGLCGSIAHAGADQDHPQMRQYKYSRTHLTVRSGSAVFYLWGIICGGEARDGCGARHDGVLFRGKRL